MQKEWRVWIDAIRDENTLSENYEHHFVNKSENLDGMDNFLKNIMSKELSGKNIKSIKRSTGIKEMESVVKNQPRKCFSQSQTFYQQVLPNSQGTCNSNFIHTVQENGKRRNTDHFMRPV